MLPFALFEAELGSAVQEGVRLVGCCNLLQRASARGVAQSAARSHPDETEAVRPVAPEESPLRQVIGNWLGGYAAGNSLDAARSGS
jgi:hypothetical protein